jgi:hypothetical protein
MYRDNGHYRVAALVSERTPVTLTYRPGSGPGLLPDSVLQKANIQIGDNVPRMTLDVPDGRRLIVRPVTIEYLRLGPHLLEDLQFYALPPEGEDLGARITDETLSGRSARAVPELLRLELPPIN